MQTTEPQSQHGELTKNQQFNGPIKKVGITTNGGDFNMKMKNVSPTRGNSPLRYYMSQSNLVSSEGR